MQHQEASGIAGIVNLAETALEQDGSERGLSIFTFLDFLLKYDTLVPYLPCNLTRDLTYYDIYIN
jgi:hypothetical protein